MSIPLILDNLISLKTAGLSIDSLWVHFTAISVYYPPLQGCSMFAHLLTNRFLKGLIGTFSSSKKKAYSSKGPEPCSFCAHKASRQTAFRVAITSARNVGELGALMADPPS